MCWQICIFYIAVQMWCLGKFLPLIIGGVIPSDDERWLHFLLLLKIVDIIFSPVVCLNDLGILEGYIEEYLWQFTWIYPGCSVIPKMHYLVHYPAHIYKYIQTYVISSHCCQVLIIFVWHSIFYRLLIIEITKPITDY